MANYSKTVLLALLVLLCANIHGAIIRIDPDAIGTNTGASWANAKTDLKAALAVANEGDEFWIKGGTYKPSTVNDRLETFTCPVAVDLYGGFAGTEIFRGQRDWAANRTIISGNIGALNDNTDNSIQLLNMFGANVDVTIDGITFRNAYNDINAYIGVLIVSNVPINIDIKHCVFNDLEMLSNDVFGVLNLEGKVVIDNCVFKNNIAGHEVIALLNESQILNSTITGNTSDFQIIGNVPGIQTVSTRIFNSIIYDNQSGAGYDILVKDTLEVSHSILDGEFGYNGTVEVLQEDFTSDDPLFVDPASGNVNLSINSPAIDAGSLEYSILTRDVSNEYRTVNDVPDIGAFEFQREIIYVNDANLGIEDGTTWATAFNTLEEALAVAAPGNQIWITEGFYRPITGNRNYAFELVDNCPIFGGFDGTEDFLNQRNWITHQVVINGDIGATDIGTDNLYHIFENDQTTGSFWVDGVVIQQGWADGPNNQDKKGSAIYCELSDSGKFVLRNSWIRANYSEKSSAVFLQLSEGDVEIQNCVFSNNDSQDANTCLAFDVKGKVESNLFAQNDGGAGPIVFQKYEDVAITNCSFIDNDCNNTSVMSTGTTDGVITDGVVEVVNSVFWANGASQLNDYSGSSVNYSYCVLENEVPETAVEGDWNFYCDPMYTDIPGADYTFDKNSVLHDTGNNDVVTVLGDVFGNTRIAFDLVDRGAAENPFCIVENDICPDATEVVVGNDGVSGSNRCAINNGYPILSCASNNGVEVWYEFEAPTSGFAQIIVEPIYSFTPNFNPKIALYSSCDPLTLFACSNNTGAMEKEEMFVNLIPGATNYIRIEGVNSQEGLFKLWVLDESCYIVDAYDASLDCDLLTGSLSATVTVSYVPEVDSGDLIVNGESFPISGSPQTITLENLVLEEGEELSLEVSLSDFVCHEEFEGLFDPAEICEQLNVIYVNHDATGNNDGSSWTDAFNDLHDAFSIAVDGQEVWIAHGTYVPTDIGDRNARFYIEDDIEVHGAFEGIELTKEERQFTGYEPEFETIISGDIGVIGDPLDNSYAVFDIAPSTNEVTLTGLTFAYAAAQSSGMSVGAVDSHASELIVNGCKFHDNENQITSCALYSRGSLTMMNCYLFDNFARAAPVQAVDLNGTNSFMKFEDCLFENNQSFQNGMLGSISMPSSTVPFPLEIHRCQFIGNHSGQQTAQFKPSALYLGVVNSRVKDCLFAENYTDLFPGYCIDINTQDTDRTLEIINNTFADNQYEVLRCNAPFVDVYFHNNITWDNSSFDEDVPAEIVVEGFNIAEFHNNIVKGGIEVSETNPPASFSEQNTIDCDPDFVAINDYHLQSNSLGLNSGNDVFISNKDLDLLGRVAFQIVDRGCYEYNTCDKVNDECTGAISLEVDGIQVAGNTLCASQSADGVSSCNDAGNDVWFSFEATEDQYVGIHLEYLFDTGNAPADFSLALFEGTCGSLNELACSNVNPDSEGEVISSQFTLTGGETYFINVRDVNGEGGAFKINVTSTFTPLIYYVDQNATGNNDGSSWEDAFIDLQNAINLSSENSQLWIAEGVYISSNSNDQEDSFLIEKDLVLIGGFNGTESSVDERDVAGYDFENETILSGEIGDTNTNTDNAHHVAKVVGSVVTFDGLTVKDGFGDSVTLSNSNGAAIFGDKNNLLENSSVTLLNCKILDNEMSIGSGALNCFGGTILVENCLFENNAGDNGAAIRHMTDNCVDCHTEIYGSSFISNHSSDKGGALWIVNNMPQNTKIVDRCVFSENTAEWDGAAIQFAAYDFTLSNCLFTNNSLISGLYGEVVTSGNAVSTYNAYLRNNTFTKNDVLPFGSGTNSDGAIYIYNSVFWNNGENKNSNLNVPEITFNGSDVNWTISKNIIQGGTEVSDVSIPNSITESETYDCDPIFNAPLIGDYTLSAHSIGYRFGIHGQTFGSIDLAGEPRLDDFKVDFGCFQNTTCQGLNNDFCLIATQLLIDDDAISGNTLCATNQNDVLIDCSSVLGNNVWYEFIAPDNGKVVIDFTYFGGIGFDQSAVVQVLEGTCISQTALACFTADHQTNVVELELNDLVPGETYKIRVESSSELASCIFKINVRSNESCTGDINGDEVINAADLLAFLAGFGCPFNCDTDLTGDDITNAADLLLFLSVFAETCE